MARASLTLAEQETIILYDNELDTAKVFTYDKRMLKKLKDLAKKYPDKVILISKDGRRSATYEIPKRCVTIRPPYSEKRREQQTQDAKICAFPFAVNESEEEEGTQDED